MSKEFTSIKFRLEDRIARITFARPPLNIFNIAMMREILSAVNECGQQRETAAIVFEAAPGAKAFSAGVAVEEHVPETVYQMLDTFHSIFRALYQTPKPTVAVLDGPALGGGCELVAACDLVIASDRARFGQPEIKLGVFPPVATILLPRIIGEKRAAELVLTGELIEADEALRLGLVNYVVSPDELATKTDELLSKLRELSSAALSMARAAFDIGRQKNFEANLNEVENLYLHELMKTADANEGVRAFMEKRNPKWRHR